MYKTTKFPRNGLVGSWSFQEPTFIIPNVCARREKPYVNLLRKNCFKRDRHDFSPLPKAIRTFSTFVENSGTIAFNGEIFEVKRGFVQITTDLPHTTIQISQGLGLANCQFEDGNIATVYQKPQQDFRVYGPWTDKATTASLMWSCGGSGEPLKAYSLYISVKQTEPSKNAILFHPPNWYARLKSNDCGSGIVHADTDFCDYINTADGQWHVWSLHYDGERYWIYWDSDLLIVNTFKFLSLDMQACWRLFNIVGEVSDCLLYNNCHNFNSIRQVLQYLRVKS